jgi:GT2 family glycosyltransferase
MTKRLSVSIVIPSLNGSELLKENLPSITAACETFRGRSEIIVVDDGSSDQTVTWLREAFPQIKTIGLERNLGFARAANTAVRTARFPFIILLNNDVRVEPDFIDPLVDRVTRKAVFATAACMRNPDRPSQVESLTRLSWEMGFLGILWPSPDDASDFPDGGEIFYACGGATVYNRNAFLELGGFESIYRPYYWEDTDLSYRAWKRGLASTFCKEAIVWHKPSQTISRLAPRARIQRIWERNKLIFQWRNLSSRMFRQHLYWFMRHLFWLTTNGGTALLMAWLSGLPKFTTARRRLAHERREETITDEELAIRLGRAPVGRGESGG